METKYIPIANAKKVALQTRARVIQQKIITKLYSVQITVGKVPYKDPHVLLLTASQIHSHIFFFKLPIWTLPHNYIAII